MNHQTFASDSGTSVRAIVAQLEAASTLLKFAADDLDTFCDQAGSEFRETLQSIVLGLRRNASTLFENALYLERIDGDDEGEEVFRELDAPARGSGRSDHRRHYK